MFSSHHSNKAQGLHWTHSGNKDCPKRDREASLNTPRGEQGQLDTGETHEGYQSSDRARKDRDIECKGVEGRDIDGADEKDKGREDRCMKDRGREDTSREDKGREDRQTKTCMAIVDFHPPPISFWLLRRCEDVNEPMKWKMEAPELPSSPDGVRLHPGRSIPI